jgi:hypothetical protein
MNPTQNQNNHEPQDRKSDSGIAAQIVGLLSNGARFRHLIAQAVNTMSHPIIPAPDTPDGPADECYTITDEGRAVIGEPAPACLACRKCGMEMSGVYSWDEPVCPLCVDIVVADNEYGYIITGSAASTDEAVAGEAPGSAAMVLRLAARYLELHGWIQGAYYDVTATVFTPAADMVGAIAMVCYGGPCETPALMFDDPGFLDFEEAVLHLDRFLLVEDGSEAYEFNDYRGRRLDDVLRVLHEAAARPAEELVDALRALDSFGEPLRDQARVLIPKLTLGGGHGWSGCPSCASTDRYLRNIVEEIDGVAYCDDNWHDLSQTPDWRDEAGRGGGDAR